MKFNIRTEDGERLELEADEAEMVGASTVFYGKSLESGERSIIGTFRKLDYAYVDALGSLKHRWVW